MPPRGAALKECRPPVYIYPVREGCVPVPVPSRRNVRLLIQYDGLPFLGWQVQPRSPTVQQVLQEVIRHVTGEQVNLQGSGRTDSGVHAVGQVANFFTASRIPAWNLARAINSLAPPSVSVLQAQEVPLDFDSRRSALGKTYLYRVLLSPVRRPLEQGRAWQVPYRLNLGRMRRAAGQLSGCRDFSSFRSSGCGAPDAVRDVRLLKLSKRKDYLVFELEGNGFLRHMVRNIVGTLVDVGRGRIDPDDMPSILEARDRRRAGRAAPPWGLYLLEVRYPPELAWDRPAHRIFP